MALAPMLLAANQPIALQPSSAWVVDYADQSCRLIRTFGAADTSTKLVFESIAPGTVAATVAGKPVAAVSDAVVSGKLRSQYTATFRGESERTVDGAPAIRWQNVPVIAFDDHDPPESLWAKPKHTPTSNSVRPPPIDDNKRAALRAERDAILASSDAFEISRPGKSLLTLETGPLTDAVHALDECERNLMKDLGVDPDVQQRLARPAWTNKLLVWITPNIYPQLALSLARESSVTVRLIIDPTGKVTNCTAITQFNAPEFKDAVCAVLAGRVLQPAELPDGTKVASYFANEIIFKIAG